MSDKTKCSVCGASIDDNLKMDLIVDNRIRDQEQTIEVTPADIQEMDAEGQETPVYTKENDRTPMHESRITVVDRGVYASETGKDLEFERRNLGLAIDLMKKEMLIKDELGFDVLRSFELLKKARSALDANDIDAAKRYLTAAKAELEKKGQS
jgi:hypothetical protein